MKKVKHKLTKEDLSDSYNFPAYSAETENGGIIGYTNTPEFICDDKSPTYITFGDHTRTFNIVKKSFSVLDNVKVLIPCIHDERSLLFVISAWQKLIPNLGYARHWKVAKKCSLLLPTKDNHIDFEFMESFIAELEARRIAELEAYLTVTGLKDYTLTQKEEKALKDFNNLHWGKFKFKNIFNKIVQGRRLKTDDQISGDIPFIMSGITNTGVVNYISNPVVSFPKNSITVDIFGNTFYRNYGFGAGDDTGVYWNDEVDYSKQEMLFFAATMNKALLGKFSFGKKLRSSQSLDLEMKLPINKGLIDFEYITILISAIQKLVIKEVVLYADRKIAVTKQTVEK